jgi:hypothetical protein
VPLQLILELESTASTSIKFNARVSCNGQCLPVGREGVVGDRVVEEMVDFRSCHILGFWLIGGALDYQYSLENLLETVEGSAGVEGRWYGCMTLLPN